MTVPAASLGAPQRPIRVLQVGGNTRVNGISSVIMGVFRRLDRRRFEFHFYNSARTRGHYEDEIERLGGRVHHGYSSCRGLARALDQMRRLGRILRVNGPFDVVHSHYYSMNGMYLLVAWLHGVPVRISHCQQSRPLGMNPFKRILVQLSRTLIPLVATRMVGCSASACSFLYPGQVSEILYNAVDLRHFDPARHPPDEARHILHLEAGLKVIACIGRLEEQKNIAFLIAALATLLGRRLDVKLVIAGSGSCGESLKDLARSSGIANRVAFLPGPIDTATLLSVTDLLVLPSLWEGLPLVLLEAQAMGIRCMVSDSITREADLGLCTYLPLDADTWSQMADVLLDEEWVKAPKVDARFNIEHLAGRFSELYTRGDCWADVD